ncbi:MAG: 1-aminocyclopropane-1-carboxylate deaminase/D-cysteine desulfhydrase [Anaerolineae bacterium]
MTLFQRFPALHRALPRAELTELPTPAHRLENLEQALAAGELWIKRDDQCGHWYGGNKPRKLEFLLGEAVAKGANTTITFGTLGTHHGLATTICAGKLGLETVLILVDEPVRDETRANLLLCHAYGARLCYAGTRRKATMLGAWHWLRRSNPLRRRFPYLIMPGGSTPRGAIGYVNAALELDDQVQAGELPEPDYIFVPVGSNGTMAGLEAGLRLTDLRTKVIGVCVSDQVRIDAQAVAKLANNALSLLSRHAPEIAGARPVQAQDVTIWHDYLGRGYAYPTPEAKQAVELMAECEGIDLELVYTGKTLAALIDAVGRPEFQSRRILFWNTYNSMPVPGLSPDEVDHRRLPPAFHRFFL